MAFRAGRNPSGSAYDPGAGGAPRAGWRKIALVALLLVGVATLGGIASFESLTSTATNGSASPYNEFNTGSVTITDNQSGSAMFTVTNADPPTTGHACIGVQYTGSVSADVYLYATVEEDTGSPALGDDITLGVQDGTDSSNGGTYAQGDNYDTSCSDFTANTNTSDATSASVGNDVTAVPLDGTGCNGTSCWPTSVSNGYLMSDTGSATASAAWSADTTVWYEFSYDIESGAPSGATCEIELTWEAVGQ